jgi:outer membrane protein assembly factor BamB
MIRPCTAYCLFSTSLILAAAPSQAAKPTDAERFWPQWRGPTANGVALQGNPPVEWSEDKNIRWKARVPGHGHATPVVWGDRIFVLTAVPAAETATSPAGPNPAPGGRRGGFGRGPAPTQPIAFTTLCLNRRTGEVLWQKVSRQEVPHEGHQQSNTFASGSPVTDGEHLFAFFGSHGLYCYTLDGELVWDIDLGDMRTRNSFGEGASPALLGNTLVVLWDTEEESYVVAFDKATGKQLWKQDREERTGWTTPYLQPFGDRTQVIINGTTAVRSYDLQTGDLLWQCAGQTANAVPSIVSDGQVAYATSGFRGNAAVAIRLGARGDLTDSDAVLWKLNRGTPYVPSPLLVDGLLILCQRNDAILSCIDAATGQAHYSQERLEGVSGVYASPVAVQGRIYVPGQNGATAVVALSKEFHVLAVNQLDEPINASPVVVGDELLLRGRDHLYCIASREP